VLRRVPLAACARPIDPPDASVPSELRELLEAQTRSAFERGHQGGLEEGLATATAAAATLPDAVRAAFADGVATLEEGRRREVDEVLALAVEIARLAVRAEPGADAHGLLDRIRGAFAELDDGPLVVGVHPAQAGELAPALAAEGVTVQPDPSLQPGEAVVRGPWSEADLRWEARWAAVREALGIGPAAPTS
jgi:flagellar biosynthesis/type III secretory pathway protein FliH